MTVHESRRVMDLPNKEASAVNSRIHHQRGYVAQTCPLYAEIQTICLHGSRSVNVPRIAIPECFPDMPHRVANTSFGAIHGCPTQQGPRKDNYKSESLSTDEYPIISSKLKPRDF
jgi:hypothetical protein